MFERAVMRRVSAVWALCALCALAAPAQAFKTSMHVRTANVAMLDARDGAISTGMTDGMEVSYARLDALVGEL